MMRKILRLLFGTPSGRRRAIAHQLGGGAADGKLNEMRAGTIWIRENQFADNDPLNPLNAPIASDLDARAAANPPYTATGATKLY